MKNAMVWKTIKIRADLKEDLDNLKELERRKKGRDPSYNDLIESALIGNIAEPDKKDKKKKGKKEGDFLELF